MTGESFSDAFLRGARLFDERAFFEAHEAWEDRWRTENDPDARRFLQGLIQIAAAFHKLLSMNAPASASRLFTRGLAKLEATLEPLASPALATFCAAIRTCERSLAEGAFESATIPSIGSEWLSSRGARPGPSG